MWWLVEVVGDDPYGGVGVAAGEVGGDGVGGEMRPSLLVMARVLVAWSCGSMLEFLRIEGGTTISVRVRAAVAWSSTTSEPRID